MIMVISKAVCKENGVPYGIRTRAAAVKGRCPRPLDEGDLPETRLIAS